MYKQIRKQKPVLQKYAELLISQGVVNQPEYEVPLLGAWEENGGRHLRGKLLVWFSAGCGRCHGARFCSSLSPKGGRAVRGSDERCRPGSDGLRSRGSSSDRTSSDRRRNSRSEDRPVTGAAQAVTTAGTHGELGSAALGDAWGGSPAPALPRPGTTLRHL